MSARRWIVVLLGSSAVCLTGFGLVLIATLLFVARRETPAPLVYPTWQDPAKVEKLKINAVLSVATLAGVGDATAISQMLSYGEIDSAFVTAIYATGLTDRQRLAQLQFIGERYTAAERAESAKLAYQALMDIAALSPALSDYERVEALAQAAGSFYALKERNLARLAIDGGSDIALKSPFLKDANRYVLLGRLLRAAQQGGDRERIQKLNDDRAGFVDLGEPNPAALQDPPDPLPAIESVKKDEALTAAQNRRIEAAKKITQVTDSGQRIPDELVEALGNALFAEDEQQRRVYSASAAQLTVGQKVALARAQIDWLTLKHRVARKAYGLSLVAEWEDTESEIRSELAKAYENLNLLRTEQAIALPKAQDIDLAQSYLLRRLLLGGRLGLYPSFPEGNLVEQLNDVTDKLIASQPNATLRIKVEISGERYYYHLVNDDDWYGQTASPTQSTATPQATATAPAARPTQAGATPQRTTQPPTQNTATAIPAPTNTRAPAPPTPTPAPTRAYP